MNDNSFKMCIDCANKQSNSKLEKGMYYCPFVEEILPNGIVYNDTDATECVNKGIFRGIYSFDNECPTKRNR
jgi:hypothetical protein